MREFEYEFAQGFVMGLRKHHKNPRNNEALIQAYNVRCTPFGLEPYFDLTNGLTTQPTVSWPYPQLLIGSSRTLLAVRDDGMDATRIYEVNADWTLTHRIDLDDLTYGEGWGRLDMVEVGGYAVLTCGTALARRDPATGTWAGYTQAAPHPLIPHVRSLCNFKGQLVGGGVLSNWYSCDSSYVVWSNIGSESCVPDRRNEAGFRRMPKGGEVYRVRRLGDMVVCYSDREIAALVPKSDPAPTFGMLELLPLGLAGPNAVGGSLQEHLFVDKAGWVWKMGNGPKLEKLGYQEFMLTLNASSIVISFDESEGDYYISDGSRCFLLSASGMSEVHQQVSSAGVVHGERCGLGLTNGNVQLEVTTDTLDFGMRGLKTVETLEVGTSGGGLMEARIHWRSERRNELLSSPWREVNAQGATACVTSGSDFQVQLRTPHHEGVDIDYLKLRWKMTDLRTLRGVYAPPTSARGQR